MTDKAVWEFLSALSDLKPLQKLPCLFQYTKSFPAPSRARAAAGGLLVTVRKVYLESCCNMERREEVTMNQDLPRVLRAPRAKRGEEHPPQGRGPPAPLLPTAAHGSIILTSKPESHASDSDCQVFIMHTHSCHSHCCW